MRLVTQAAAPVSLDGDESLGDKEIVAAIGFYAKKTNRPKEFPGGFKAYKRADVKAATNEAFFFKCAYCETYYGASAPVDVEHFRPKAAVTINGRKSKPGYYWLAAHWDNLLASCIFCNRENKQTMPDGSVRTSGKGNNFPLGNEAQRATAPGDETRKRPLLLNPYRDDPDKHLVFDKEGIIRARRAGNGHVSKKGQTSIDIYGLQRSGLVQDRARISTDLAARIERIEKLARADGDVVMKGGITSGVVYPHAICERAKTYRLVNVGGTSAGAIAAAAAGAAEVGRAQGGFEKLEELPSWIGAEGNLLSLFQPALQTRRLFSILLASLGRRRRRLRIITALIRGYWLSMVAGAAPGLLVVALALWRVEGLGLLLSLIGGAVVALVGSVLGVGVALYRDLLRVPGNSFGLCSGLGGPSPPALTPWLADLIDDLASRPVDGRPLTFADLEASGVRLELMTTNLTQRRPLRLPWVRPEAFFFDPSLFRTLFPERVVAHLEDPPPSVDDRGGEDWKLLCQLLLPLRPLPPAAHLPVVFGARLSLSFPLLLSAIPLHAVDWSRKHNQEAMAAWRE